MIRNKIYYGVKPLVPAFFRQKIRRWVVSRLRRKTSEVWPVFPGSERPPAGWSGWPDGKQFAFILTHDVEGQFGLDQCHQLMEMERERDFRSSFNFVPEGDYRVSAEQREELTRNGFEVGVHDLHHDGKLYTSREVFAAKAAVINQYLRSWGAVGFRAGFMFHNLEWLQDLDVLYDASTFDTDPFEPQPDGMKTIFPFWKEGENNRGYVELPYTLVQDSTLFLLLGESTSDIWKRKLDWIAEHGGMVLLDVHPDYLSFAARGRRSFNRYPAAWYSEFLDYVKNKYGGQYWNATPAEVAQWHKSTCLAGRGGPARKKRLRGRKAAVLLYSYYASDARPRREAEALVHEGAEVDLICLRENDQEPASEIMDGIHIRRIPISRRRQGKFTYLRQYGFFVGWCAALLALWSFRKRYDLVHVHNMPDFLVFSAVVPKLRGTRVLLDLHDPMPELMMTIFGLPEETLSVRFLKLLEKLSIGFADEVLTVNARCKEIFIARSGPREKIEVVMNCPDGNIFGYKPVPASNGRDLSRPFVIMYHGSIVNRNGLDLAVEAVGLVRKEIPGAELRIYGARTPFLETVLDSVQKSGLTEAVRYLGPRTLDQIVGEIDGCDIGIISNRKGVFTELNTPIRIFEYLSRGKAVIAPQTGGIVDYFGPDDLFFFRLGDAEDLARQIKFVYSHPREAEETVRRGQQIYLAHEWNCERERFLGRVERLFVSTAQKTPPPPEPVVVTAVKSGLPES